MTETVRLPRLVVLTTTYPRWQDDHEPSFVHELARRLTGTFEVVVVCPHARGSERREVLNGVSVERFRYAPDRLETLVNDGGIVANLRRAPWKWMLVPGFIVMHWAAARRQIKNGVVVHAHWILTPGLIARMLGVPFVVTSHGADLFALRGRLLIALKRFVLHKARAVTVVSRSMVAEASLLLGTSRAAISPMGVDLSHLFVPDHKVQREPASILFVGRLVEKKGVDLLLRAMNRVRQVIPEARLTIVGFGPLEGALRRECRDLGLDAAVRFTGAVTQGALVPMYQSASVFVAPFRTASSGDREGLGLVLVEALGCGCPVVTSDVPAVHDVASGQPGFYLVPPGDEIALAERIVSVLAAYDIKAMESARDALVARFDWAVVADRYAALLKGAAGTKGEEE